MVKKVAVNVRGVDFVLMGYTRSLELCARMNYETEVLDFIDQMNFGACFYDLGACEGRFSIYAALKGMQVFSFEPEKRNFKVLTENVEVNNLSHAVTKYNLAVGKETASGIMKVGQPWEGGHQKVVDHEDVRRDLNFDFVEEQIIEVVSLDEHIRKYKLPLPEYLKIDIDGSEVPFLNGAIATLASTELKGIIFELDKGDKNFPGILQRIQAAGFELMREFRVPNEPSLFNMLFRRS